MKHIYIGPTRFGTELSMYIAAVIER